MINLPSNHTIILSDKSRKTYASFPLIERHSENSESENKLTITRKKSDIL